MNAFFQQVVVALLKRSPRDRILIVIGVTIGLCLVANMMVLRPYLGRFFSVESELKAHQKLLDAKQLRAKAIATIKGSIVEYQAILASLSGHYFNQVEAEAFVKSLDTTIFQLHNRVLALKPKLKTPHKSRSEAIKAYIHSLTISTKEKVETFITRNKQGIDQAGQSQDLLGTMQKMIPEGNRDPLKSIWMQAQGDLMQSGHLDKIELELSIQGDYTGFVSLLNWFAAIGKQIEISDISMKLLPDQNNQLETKFVLSLYAIQDQP